MGKAKDKSNSSVFFDGLLKGLSAPAMLFASAAYVAPVHAEPIRTHRPIDLDALRSDWEKIGADFRIVIEREESKSTSE